jgi:hypothetical protein
MMAGFILAVFRHHKVIPGICVRIKPVNIRGGQVKIRNDLLDKFLAERFRHIRCSNSVARLETAGRQIFLPEKNYKKLKG